MLVANPDFVVEGIGQGHEDANGYYHLLFEFVLDNGINAAFVPIFQGPVVGDHVYLFLNTRPMTYLSISEDLFFILRISTSIPIFVQINSLIPEVSDLLRLAKTQNFIIQVTQSSLFQSAAVVIVYKSILDSPWEASDLSYYNNNVQTYGLTESWKVTAGLIDSNDLNINLTLFQCVQCPM